MQQDDDNKSKGTQQSPEGEIHSLSAALAQVTVQGGTATPSTAPSVSVATPQMHEIGGKLDPRGARPKRTLQFSKNPKLEPLAEERHKELHAGEVFVAQTFTHSKGTEKVITGKYLKYDKLAISVQ